jgi:hypothetical protein
MSHRVRRLWPYAAPLGLLIATLAHPGVPRGAVDIAEQLNLWLVLHSVQILLIIGLGLTLRSLVADQTGGAAVVARAAIWVFVAVYAAFDAVAGIGTGVIAGQAATLTGDQAAAVMAAADVLFGHSLVGALGVVGGVAWLVAASAAAVALRRAGASIALSVALVASGVLLAITHVGVPGAASALALVYAVHRFREQGVVVGQPQAEPVR